MHMNDLEQVLAAVGELATGYGMDLALDAIGLGQAASMVDALIGLSEVVGADDKRSAVEKEAAQFLIDDLIEHLTATA